MNPILRGALAQTMCVVGANIGILSPTNMWVQVYGAPLNPDDCPENERETIYLRSVRVYLKDEYLSSRYFTHRTFSSTGQVCIGDIKLQSQFHTYLSSTVFVRPGYRLDGWEWEPVFAQGERESVILWRPDSESPFVLS